MIKSTFLTLCSELSSPKLGCVRQCKGDVWLSRNQGELWDSAEMGTKGGLELLSGVVNPLLDKHSPGSWSSTDVCS